MLSTNSNKPDILEENNNNLFLYPENKNQKTIKNFQLNIFMA